ncbi:hypothetical protein LZC95_20105 [Pendulispora brunnea]|uniref:Uncharacterized protein n=1 Tax=Pendulispora brunnea TaxID=2905690 RepID=A0ABZ2KN52_9BACT
MSDDAKSNAVTATVGPQYPDWLTETKEMGEKPFRKETVKLYGFNFLGRPFASGVNDELLQRLLVVQKKMYDLAKVELEKPDKDLTQEEFTAWVWLGQNPVWLDKGAIEAHVGFRNGDGFHASGSAVDINLLFNPYIALRKGDQYGGEGHTIPDSLKFRKMRELDQKKELPADDNDLRALLVAKKQVAKALEAQASRDILTRLVWKPGVDVYDRAYSLYYGTPADVKDDPKGTAIEDTVKRFQRVHFALMLYFGYVFQRTKQRTFDEFSALFLASYDGNNGIHPEASGPGGKGLLSEAMAGDQDGTLHAMYDQIVRDRDNIRLVTVVGKVTITDDGKDGIATLPGGTQRDPTRGIMNLRGELIVELVQTAKLRWGGVMFGAVGTYGSGDMMHFDLGTHLGK